MEEVDDNQTEKDIKKGVGIIIVIALIGIFAYIFLFTGSTMATLSGVGTTITNGNFETGNLNGWTVSSNNATVMVDGSAAHSGNYGANLTVNSRT